ncbi:MAG: protein-disulfide reductase DsbD N-terminal domain-containing protein [Pyrinomonadaceae bacterium]|nr:protein-disulfide reductase DsbD N-terminal domain-containing protein [Blastocatellia bacterium]MCW5956866.1 protein-disulfide reductase DsbD N-terminal domain-containing protein [Pyrinomonadaceae bacterium]
MRSFEYLFAVLILGIVSTYGQSVSGSITGGSVTRGGSAKGSIVLTIPGGLHVNSSRPASEYAIPTTVRLSGAGVRISGPTFPRGVNRKFQFSENTINVYEGTVRFPFTVTVPTGFKGDTVRLRAVVRYQACTDEVCYPPRNKEITITARVR